MRALGVAICVLCTANAAAQSRRAAPDPLTPLDAYVERVMKDWKVPGVAIAVVRNDSLVHARGYGVRELGKAMTVDPSTVFAIGSASKAFTSALVAMQVDAGTMRWDEPVTSYLPDFRLHDNYATRDLTVRDALSHRSGLARGDLLWYAGNFPREEILRRVRYLEPSWGFRGLFGYQNIMYLAAGEAAARTGRASWDAQIRTRIFGPLGMNRSSTTISDLSAIENVASPHNEFADTVTVIRWKNIDNIAPAGSINSSVNDMAQWLRLQLGQGMFNGRQLISQAGIDEMWSPNTPIRLQGPTARFLAPGANLASYGLGWFLQDFNGRLAVHHGGNIDGFSAVVAMLPSEKLGVVVLTNMNGTPAPQILWPYMFDLHTRESPRDWSAAYQGILGGLRKAATDADAAIDKARVAGTKPSLALDRYAGTYVDSMYGELEVAPESASLRIRLGLMTGRLDHWHYDTFRGNLDDRQFGKAMVTFRLDANGKAAEARLASIPEATFRFVSPRADTTAGVRLSSGELEKLSGVYAAEGLPIELTVQLVGSELKASIPGQPAYTLVPATATRFRLTGPPGMPDGFFLEFDLERGRPVGATLVQPAPQPVLRLRRKAP